MNWATASKKLVNNSVYTEKKSRQGRPKRASSRALWNHFITESSRLNKPPKMNDRKRKQSTARFILSSVDLGKVFKAFSKKRNLCQKMNVLYDVSQTEKKTTINYSAPRSKCKQVFKVKNATSAFVHLIHSSKVSKPGAKRSIKLRKNNTKLASTTGSYQLTKDNLGTLSIPSMDRKAMIQSIKVSLRRSTRISKQPERFRLSYAWESAMAFFRVINFVCTNNKCWMYQ